MKRINKFLNMILFSILSLSMAFGFVLNSIQLPTRKLDAATSTSSKVYTTDYYTLSYSNNEVKLLLNSDLRVYQNFSKQDLKDLKDAIISVGYTAILDDIDFTTDQPSVKKRAVSPKIGENVDVSLIQDIIANQLINFETIDNALDINGTYDTLIEYYVDRYVDVFIEANPTSNVENVFAEVKEQLTISIQETVNHVYEQAGALDNAPNVSNKIHSLVQNVEDLKANDQKVEISLNDLTDIFKTIDNTTTIVEIVNDLQLATEVKDVIKNSESEEIVNFFVSVDTSTITNVFQNVKLDNVELKEIVSSVGVDNIIEIVDTIGMDNVIEIAKSANLTKDDLQEIIKNNVSDISIASLIKSIESISINGNPIFANDEFKMSGLEALIKSLPRPSEIANLSDEEKQKYIKSALKTLKSLPDDGSSVRHQGEPNQHTHYYSYSVKNVKVKYVLKKEPVVVARDSSNQPMIQTINVTRNISSYKYIPKLKYLEELYNIFNANYKILPIDETQQPFFTNGANTTNVVLNDESNGIGLVTLQETWREDFQILDSSVNQYKVSYYDEEDYEKIGRRVSRIEWKQDWGPLLTSEISASSDEKSNIDVADDNIEDKSAFDRSSYIASSDSIYSKRVSNIN